MRKHSKFIFVLFLVFGCQPAPDFSIDGKKTGRWHQFDGQWLIISYWAEWCKPCLEEIPLLNEVQSLPNASVIGINFDNQSRDSIEKVRQKWGMNYPTVQLNTKAPSQWEMPQMLPAAFIRDPQGQLSGPYYGKAVLEEAVAVFYPNLNH